MTKIKIRHTLTNRQLAHQYERVGVYRVSTMDMSFLVHTLLGVYDRLPDFYPALKAGKWEFDFTRPIEFQAIAYTDASGWKMLMMVENEDRYGATVTFAFSGMEAIPYLSCKDYEPLFLKGPEMMIPWIETITVKQEPPKPKPLTRWQRFKNWFRRKPSTSSSSGTSILDDIGEVISDIVD
ncbi:hypothetical protein D3C80_835460 [compost metagenome]